MKRRVLATMLWFYTGWYAGAMIAEVLGVSAALGPILGTAAAAFIAVDPRRVFWPRPTRGGTEGAPDTRSVQNAA